MLISVVKRDGTPVEYNGQKILAAMAKANLEVEENQRLSDEDLRKTYAAVEQAIEAHCAKTPIITVEEIQDLVEEQLVSTQHYPVAKKYILYRFTRHLVREQNTTDDTILTLIEDANKEVADENSNKNAKTVSTQRDLIAGEVSRDISRRLLLPPNVRKAHEEGQIHFHDLDYHVQRMHNCDLVNIKDIFENGTVMNGKLVETPKSFQVACTVMTQVIAAVASSQYGGQSLNIKHLSKYLKVSEDKIRRNFKEVQSKLDTESFEHLVQEELQRELSSGVQTIQYQINTLFSTNGQSPFVTLFLELDHNDEYIDYTAKIIEEMLKQRIQGIKNEAGVYVSPAFPKLVYVLDDWNNLTGGKYDCITHLAAQCSAKRMMPDYISAKIMREHYEGNVFSPMGCRSFLSPWKDENGNYKFEGRFNQGVVSINLVQPALMAPGDEDKYFDILEERLQTCYEALMYRHKSLVGTKSDVAPILWQYGAIARLKPGEVIDPLLEGGYSTISLGYIGVYEATKLITGESHTTEKGSAFATRLMDTLRAHCEQWKKETGLGFGLYGTPAESLCYRFARIDQAKFGDVEDITDKGYYTNSYHVDVREHIDAFSKLKFESQFQTISSGGAISYVEVPNMFKNINALEEVIHFIYDNIQYAEFNTKCDYCFECGYEGEIQVNDNNEWECPVCHNKERSRMSVVRRTCGYLGENFWNEGKTKEMKLRVTHL